MYLAQEVAGGILHDPDIGLRFAEADVVRPEASLVEIVRAAGREHLIGAGKKGTRKGTKIKKTVKKSTASAPPHRSSREGPSKT